ARRRRDEGVRIFDRQRRQTITGAAGALKDGGAMPASTGTVKLLIADVDGTLVTHDKALTARAKEAVRRLREAGIGFAITSGRPPRGMSMLVEPLGIATPVAAFNGGMLVEPDLATILHQLCVSKPAALEAVDRMLAAGLDVWVYRGSDWFVRRIDAPHVAR